MHFNIQHLLQQYGYQGVLFALLLEMIGVPFPGETILTLSGIEWKQGTFSLLPLIIVAWIGNIIGSTISYIIGRFLGRTVILRFGKYVGITEEKFNTADKRFNKYRVPVVFWGKFIAGIRVLVAYLAGINRMDFWKFSFYNATGSLLWILVFIIFGRYVDIAWQRYHQTFHQILLPIIVILLIVLIAVFVKKRSKRSLN
jgi:membrane protein DedA with SNARE-associated domain